MRRVGIYPGNIVAMDAEHSYTAFAGDRRIAAGPLGAVLLELKARIDRAEAEAFLVFEDDTGKEVDFDFRGTPEEVVARAMPPERSPGPGRPKLGVVSREISPLPRHWDWLESQPNGISAAIRRLVEEARKRDPDAERARRAVEAASRVMTVLAGNRPGFEEASRALFARDRKGFDARVRAWPEDIRKHLEQLVSGAMGAADKKPST